jgi:hypothetical protein
MIVATEHELRRSGEGWAGTIPYRYTNRSGAPVYLVNCNGDVSPGMQRLVHGTWSDWWIPATNLCLSPAVVIPPAATYSDTLHVMIAPSDGIFLPELVAGGDTTRYRLIWHQALSSFDASARPFGPAVPIEHRASNAFVLTLRQ